MTGSLLMDITLRNEKPEDYSAVENLTREAFWNMYQSGCVEHYILHNLRTSPDFIPELDFVAELDGKIVGNIVYATAKVVDDKNDYDVIGFGPISVLPEYQNKGIGSKMINHTVELGRNAGYKAIIILGDPAYYGRFGFIAAKNFNIAFADGNYLDALLVLKLYPDALKVIKGKFSESKVYEDIDEGKLEIFDRSFPHKEKGEPRKPIK
jgi:predicted N-acetyltransferase YhbS